MVICYRTYSVRLNTPKSKMGLYAIYMGITNGGINAKEKGINDEYRVVVPYMITITNC